MLKKFAAGLLATALIAGPALAQTSTTLRHPPTVNAPMTKTVPVKPAPSSAMAAPAATNAKQAVNPTTVVKHAKVHKKSVKRVAHHSHKASKVSQSRHLKSAKAHQAKAKVGSKAGSATKRS